MATLMVVAVLITSEMNDIRGSWRKISRGVPWGRQAANNRAIQALLEFPDRRIKPIVYTMISSRIRIGAWDFLKWKYANPLYNEKGGIMAAKLIVYANEADRRILFIHYARSIYVTKGLDGLSCVLRWEDNWWLVANATRVIWPTTNMNYWAKEGPATAPKRLFAEE